MSNVLELRNVKKHYQTPAGRIHVLNGVDLVVKEGERVAILGQSGSGKSTLLHIAGALDAPTSGEVLVAGRPLKGISDRQKAKLRNEALGFIYQHHHLMRDFTALENVMMPLDMYRNRASSKIRAQEILIEMGLKNRLPHYPGELSGGEQQRVAVARAMVNSPKLLLADEPTGNLDPQTADKVFNSFERMMKEHKMALLMVTHNEAMAKRCDKVFKMSGGKLVKV